MMPRCPAGVFDWMVHSMKFYTLPLLIAFAFTLTGCTLTPQNSNTEPTETMIVYRSLPLPDLFVDIPEGYSETSSKFYDKFYIKDDATIIITADNDNGNMSSWDYSIDALTQYQKITHSLDVLGDEVVYANSRAVQLLEFTYTLEEGGTPMSTMAGFSSDGYTMYIVTCKCQADTYESHRDEFLTVMQSMQVDKSWVGAAERQNEQ